MLLQIKDIVAEGISNPTPLMRLMLAWSKNPSYFAFFGFTDANGVAPLSELLKLLEPESNTRAICSKMCIDVVHNLLRPETDDESDGSLERYIEIGDNTFCTTLNNLVFKKYLIRELKTLN